MIKTLRFPSFGFVPERLTWNQGIHVFAILAWDALLMIFIYFGLRRGLLKGFGNAGG